MIDCSPAILQNEKTDCGIGGGGGISCGCGSSNGIGCCDNCSGGTNCG